MTNNQNRLTRYIGLLCEQRDRRNQELSPEEMQRIALDIGLSEADLQQAEHIARDHHRRAQNFMRHQRYQDAVAELQQAAPLLSHDVPLHLDLSHGYLGLNDSEQAEHWARYCLQLDPGSQDAVALLNQIDQHQVRRPVTAKKKSRSGLVVALGSISCLVSFIAIAGLVSLRGAQAEPPPQPTPTPTPVITAPKATTTKPVRHYDPHRDIPLRLSSAQQLVMERPRSRLNNYGIDSYYYDMTALLRNTSDQDFVDIRARLVLRDQKREDVFIKDITPLLKMDGAYVEPGEAVTVSYTAIAKHEVASAELIITATEQVPHSQLYVPKPVEFEWAVQKPDLAELAITERRRTVRELSNNRESMRLSLVFTNRSPSPLTLIQFHVDVFDADGNLLTDNFGFAVHRSQPNLLTGESRTQLIPFNYEGKMASYRVRINDIQ